MSERKKFEGVLDRHFEASLLADPVAANHAGLKSGEGKLGRLNASAIARDHRRNLRTLRDLDGINPRELSAEQHLDRLALRSQLLQATEDHDRGWHRLNPEAPETVMNLLLHELMGGEDEPARAARNLRSVLRQAPDFLAEAATVADRPEKVWRKVMIEGCAGVESLLDAVRSYLSLHQPAKRDEALITAAAHSVGMYRDQVAEQGLAPPGSFGIGAAAMQRRVRDELGLNYTLGEVESLALREAERIGTLLEKACARHGRGKSADEIIELARSSWDPGTDLMGMYRAETDRVAAGFRSARAVTFPKGDQLVVRLVPEFMRHLFPTAAYSAPGAFEQKQKGTFWVNDLSAVRKTEKEKLAERQQHFGVSLTAGHEAYPGHHLQFVTANRHPRRWRRLFAHAVFYEGWTLWCEQMLVDLKIDRSPWTKIQQLHDALWRVHRILVDLRLQAGRYSYRQAAGHLQRHLGFTKARSEAEINWYSMAPGVPMSYWLGRLENARLHDRLVKGRGWKLKQFNDWLLSFGTLPQGWLEKYGLE
jgi:uncharacterized protein (DUF885 family)